jgi:hypothetical protein
LNETDRNNLKFAVRSVKNFCEDFTANSKITASITREHGSTHVAVDIWTMTGPRPAAEGGDDTPAAISTGGR